MIERHVPSAAKGEAIPHILIARSPEQARRIARNLRITLPESRRVVDAVSVGVGQGEICAPEPAGVRHLPSKARLQTVVALVGDVFELGHRTETADRAV